MRARLRERRPEGSDVISFVFDLMGQPFSYVPGQYVYYELDELRFPDERGKRRHFTISSSPTETGIVMFTTRMRGSGFKETVRQAPLGYELTVERPLGSFVLRAGETRRQVFIAGGIGITPYRSILRHAADTKVPLAATLLHFGRTAGDLIFRGELEGIARQIPAFAFVPVVTEPEEGWRGEHGSLDEALLRRHVPDFGEVVFWISGPPPMVLAFADQLKRYGVSEDAIRLDSFLGY
jgi:ferredoxin-NADP reductase